jgi:cell division septum initiation protein DivIVA
VSDSLPSIAQKLRNLADGRPAGQNSGRAPGGGKPAGEPALKELADRLVSKEHAADLLSVNLAQAYAPEVMLPEDTGRLHWALNVIEIVRDVLIFGPVIYTWFQLSRALRAYSGYQGKDPFLLAWQQGFNGRTQPLSDAALVVAGLVFAIVVLTLVSHLVRTYTETRVTRRQQELAVLLAKATLQLRLQGVSGAQVTREEVASMSDAIIRAALTMRESVEKTGRDIIAAVNTSPGGQLQDMFQRWTAAANELTTLGKQLQGTGAVVAQLRDTQTELARMTKTFVTESGQLREKIAAETNQFTAKIGAETRQLLIALHEERTATMHASHAQVELANKVDASAGMLAESLRELSERAVDFNKMVIELAAIIEDLRGGDDTAEPDGLY